MNWRVFRRYQMRSINWFCFRRRRIVVSNTPAGFEFLGSAGVAEADRFETSGEYVGRTFKKNWRVISAAVVVAVVGNLGVYFLVMYEFLSGWAGAVATTGIGIILIFMGGSYTSQRIVTRP
jgi:hypothetical protein